TGAGIGELQSAIQQQIASMPHVFNTVPDSYFRIKADIEQKARREDFLETEDFDGICLKHGLQDPQERKNLLRFLHDLGSVLNFDDPADPYKLRDTKILNPEWVTSAVYRIINNPQLRKQREGELEFAQLSRILDDDRRYPPDKHQYILEIMRKFELCFEFPNSNGQRFLIPELLPVREPDLDWHESDLLRFEYHYDVLPGGLICRLIVRNAKYLGTPPVYWLTGAVFHIGQNRVLVRADLNRQRIVVQVADKPATRSSSMQVIHEDLEHIHSTIPSLSVKRKVPLPDEPKILVDYDHLLKLQELGIDRFLPEGANRQYELSQLLSGTRSTAENNPQTLYIRKLILKNIRCFGDLEIDFGTPAGFRPFTMLLGDNGAGKTTVLRALALAFCDDTGASSLVA
ncbi:MAG: AAA family ATPase, partial [Planctomycetaceae bacterium]|nr:AAA family ATPase [Planctomycetaceae bacterium]